MSEMINPYIAGAPVTEKTMFFGRQDVFEWVQRSLTGKFVNHILVIHGQRRIGKTSVLKQIPFHLPPTYIPVFFDLQGRTHTTIDRFLWRLAKEIARTVRDAEDISLSESTKEEYAEDAELFQNQFLPQLSQAIGDRRLLLIFDEFDSLEESTAKEMLAQDLVPYLSRLMHAPGPLAFIFCIGSSGRKLEHMQASYTDFFRIALYRKISFLEKKEAARLITQPAAGVIEYAPQAVEDIFGITSGHPYFTQLLCHELFGYCQKSGKTRIAPRDVEAVLDDVVERGTVNLKFVWDDASDSERYVLTALSLSEDGRDAKSIHKFLQGKKVRISQREVGDSLRHLQEKDVLASDNTFTVDLMRLWLLENEPLERVIEELIEVSPIATRYIEIAEEFREAGNQEEALDSYRRALRVDSHNLRAQVGIASLTYERGDLSQSADEYQKALDIDPEDIHARSGFCQTHLALGDQLRAQGRVEEALEHYRQVLTANEQHVEAQERLAAHHAQVAGELRAAEKFDEAIEAFSKALEFTPEDPAIAERLAETRAAKRTKGLTTLREAGEEHFRAQRWEQAIGSFEEYLSLEPGDEEAVQAVESRLTETREQGELAATYSQAQAALNQKRPDEAMGLLKEIINRDVSYKDATRLLTQAVELQREARPIWKDIRVLGGAGGGLLLVIIAVLLVRFLPGLAPGAVPPAQSPSIAPTRTPGAVPPAQTSSITPTPSPEATSLLRTLQGSTTTAGGLAFSPDGTTLASNRGSNVILWDVRSGQQLHRLLAEAAVYDVAFSPEGATLASASLRGAVTLWDVETGQELRTLEGHAEIVYTVAFSPDGTTLATGSFDDTVILWAVETGQQLRTLQGHTDNVYGVAFSPDGEILASASGDETVILWDVDTGQQLRTLEGPAGTIDTVYTVAFSPDGQILASGSSDKTVMLWDVESGQQLRALEGHKGVVDSVVFSPDGQILATGSYDKTVMLWYVETGRQANVLEGHSGAVYSVAFSPDGAILASGAVDGTVMLWDMEAVIAGPAPTPSAPTLTLTPPSAPTAPAEECALRVGMVSDIGGVDDASFNQNTWQGLVMAEEELGVCAQFIESQAQADYEKNITEFAEQDYELIITVAYLLGDATAKMAAQYPDVKFGIVDYAYDPGIPNVVGIVFATDEAAFMTGYLAAAWADLKDPADPAVGYVAGMQIPTVEIFVAGHTAGIAYYNEKYGKDVRFSGTYVGDFEAPDEGKTQGLSLIDEGADVILGIGGPTGNGGLVAAKERGVWGVGVDADQFNTLPNEQDILITSTIKRLDMAVFNTVKSVLDGTFAGGGVYVGTLANEGVGMAPFHDFEGQIPAQIVADLEEIRLGIIDGTIDTGWEG